MAPSQSQTQNMIARSIKSLPSGPAIFFLLFCSWLGWQIRAGIIYDDEPPMVSPAPESPPGEPRVAIVTFVTEERSYLHLSLKNKDRTFFYLI